MRRATAWLVCALALIGLALIGLRWRGLFGPVARPALRAVEPGEVGASTWDLLALVRGDVGRPAERAVASRSLYGETRLAVATRVPDEITYPVTVPPAAVLDLGYAVEARAFMTDLAAEAGPVEIDIVLTDDGGATHTLLDQRVDIRDRSADRRWFDTRVDLAPYAHVRGSLTFGARAAGGTAGTAPITALFATPRILQPARAMDTNLLLITVDCLRADHVGAYGYRPPTTPILDRLAADGVRFAHAYSTAPMTLPSLPQLLTSNLFPTATSPTFLATVNAAGIPSAAIVHNVWLVLWLTLGRSPQPLDGFDRLLSVEARGNVLTDQALAWLEQHRGDRFALYLHYLDAHSPFNPRPAYARLFRDPAYHGRVGDTFDAAAAGSAAAYSADDIAAISALYDGGVRFVDDEIGRLLDYLRREGTLDRTVVVVTADHGEEFGEHGAFFHGQSLHDELLHVPLLVRLPGAAHAGTVIERQVRGIDVVPSMLEWAGLPRPPGFAGRSLADVIAHPDDPSDDLVATATIAQFPTRYALRTPGWKLIDDAGSGTRTLFDLVHDPAERHDLLADASEQAMALGRRLAAARDVLRRRGFQLRIVGPSSGAAPFQLRLEDPANANAFATLDRVDGGGAVSARLSPDGRRLEVSGDANPEGSGFRFDRPLSAPAGTIPSLDWSLEVDGAPAGADSLRLGASGRAATDGRLALDATLETDAPPTCVPPTSGVRICLWRYPEGTAAGGPAAPDPAQRERLRALGYVQ